MVDRFERFSFAIMCISRYWNKIAAEEMEKIGLKGPHAIYLTALSHYSEGITAVKLGELCGKDKSDVSRTVNHMEKIGLAVKEGGRYRALIKLTPKGKSAALQVQKRAKVAVDLAGGSLDESEREIMYNALELIATNLYSISQNGLPQEK